jgi:methionyl aminopeptidase
VTTRELDEVGADVFEQAGARSAPMLAYGFPGTNCISINDEAVHGVPSDRKLRAGDLVKLDVTAELDGYMADSAISVPVAETSYLTTALVAAAEHAVAGRRVNEIGRAVEAETTRAGFKVLTELGGHGIGRTIHEEPHIPNHYVRSDTTQLTDGLVITIEPIIAATTSRVKPPANDGWTLATADGSLSAHVEHTIVITRGAPVILTAAA